jgi:ABC-2 type transport system permease protein
MLIGLGIVISLTIICSFVFFKVDLTAEKRHTLTPSTIEMLENLEDKVFVRCYLTGEFPAGFKRLERAVKESLDEFRDYSNGQVEYEFIDIYESGTKNEIAEKEQTLTQNGLEFTVLNNDQGGEVSHQLVWPGAIISYRNKEYPVQFFKSKTPTAADAMINSSVNNLEFELASTLRMALRPERPAIAVLEGHSELQDIEMAYFLDALNKDYAIEFVTLDGKLNVLSDKAVGAIERVNKYNALIIAKPDSMFSDQDRGLIDQYIMNGGKVLWMVDPVLTDLDSLSKQQQTIGISNEMGLYEMLFEYGCRTNRNIIIDKICAQIGMDAGPMGNQRGYQMYPWYYTPLLLPIEKSHPIGANLDPIKVEFASSLDTVNENPNIKKTPILMSSQYSKEYKTPVRINSGIVALGAEYFEGNDAKPRIMGLLMEGVFPSAFKDRVSQVIKQDSTIAFKEQSVPTKMIVIGDGDIVRNPIKMDKQGPYPLPLGYDRYLNAVVYDNLEFLLNCMNYLLDDQALISVRSRTIELRQLDPTLVDVNKTRIIWTNTVLPVVLVVVLGMTLFFIRKRKWAKALKA